MLETPPPEDKDKSTGPIDVSIGARIRHRRTQLGLSQERLGEMLGLNYQQIHRYEGGLTRVGAARLFVLSGALDVPISYFFTNLPDDRAANPGDTAGRRARRPARTPEPWDADVLERPETQALVKAYYGIAEPLLRQRVTALVEAMGEARA